MCGSGRPDFTGWPHALRGLFTAFTARLGAMNGVVPLYAHRLGRAYGPDNSATALAGALAAGVEGLEADLCLSADGELVLLHDPWLPQTTRLVGFAHERSGCELRRAGLLALDDLLAAAPRAVDLQLEVKAHADPALAARTVEVLVAQLSGVRGQRVEVLSFTVAACERAASLGLPARLVIWADDAPALARWARRHDVVGVCVEHFLPRPPRRISRSTRVGRSAGVLASRLPRGCEVGAGRQTPRRRGGARSGGPLGKPALR
jgi:hypothetical protein